MFKLIINNTLEFMINAFNRNTSFSPEGMYSNGFLAIATNGSALYALAENKITSLKILKGEEVLYELNDIEATITSIDEQLGMDQMNTNVNIKF